MPLQRLPLDEEDVAVFTAPEGHHVRLLAAPVATTLGTAPCDIVEVLRTQVTVLRHIPARLQHAACLALAKSIDQYVSDLSDQALFAVLAFPKLVLRHANLKGKFQQSEVEMPVRR